MFRTSLFISIVMFIAVIILLSGTSDVLFAPRTFSNDSLGSAKLSLIQAVTESVTQKVVADQLKMDSLFSQECERLTSYLTK